MYKRDVNKKLKIIEQLTFEQGYKNGIKCKDKVLKFAKDYEAFCFERTEKKSGDIITFDCLPFEMCVYWEEFQEVAVYIGRFRNISCGDTYTTGAIERFYMLSDGAFYNQDKKKIADNSEIFWDYVMTVEYDYHAPILESTYRRLKEAGWYEGRKIDISGLVKECEKNGVYLTELQKNFIEEFGGLESSRQNSGSNWIYISDNRIIQSHNTEFYYFINIFIDENLELENEEISPVVKKYGANTVRIGEYGYYPQSILLAENGLILLADDGGSVKPLGRTAMEGFNVLLGD